MPIKRMIKTCFEKMGYEIKPFRLDRQFSMEAALRRCSKRDFNIRTVIDVGASTGTWSATCIDYFSDASYFLIEANELHKDGLEAFKKKHKNIEYVLAAAGDKVGQIYFDDRNILGGVASEKKVNESDKVMKMTSLDYEVEKNKLEGPFLIKLDTHGFEVPILEGAINTLKDTEILIVEAYNYKIANESLKFYELCQYLLKLGFAPLEIADPLLRKQDQTFWQMDIFFVKTTRTEFASASYD